MFYKNGVDFEQAVFGHPEEVILELPRLLKPTSFKQDVGRIVKSIIRSRSHKRFPQTPIARNMYFGVKRCLDQLSIKSDGLRLFSLVGTDADRYYETDGLFYLPPSCGYECVVTVDAYLIDPQESAKLREYWVDALEGHVYSEETFQTDLFAHNRVLSEYLSSKDKSGGQNWVLSKEYKNLWMSGYIPPIPDEMIDRPMMKPENHLIFTPYHLKSKSRKNAFAREVALELWRQIFPDKTKAEYPSYL